MDPVSVDSEQLARTAASLRDLATSMSGSGDRFADSLRTSGFGHLLESDQAAAETFAVVQDVVEGVRGQVDELLAHADALQAQAGSYRSTEEEAARSAAGLNRS